MDQQFTPSGWVWRYLGFIKVNVSCHLKKHIWGKGHFRSNWWHPILSWFSNPEPVWRHQFSPLQSLSHVQLFATPWAAACQASLSITNSWSLLISIESVMPPNHLILYSPLLLLTSIFPSIRVFSNEPSSLHQVAKVLEFQLQHQSFQQIFRTDFL